jgi:hypothetical protein
MIDFPTSAVDAFAKSATTFVESTTKLTSQVPIVGNAAICVDSLCTTGRAGINFYYSPNPLAKVFFGASCACGLMGAASSGTALATSCVGILLTGWVGSFGARGFNRLGKYSLHMGNITNGNLTNATDISDLMS